MLLRNYYNWLAMLTMGVTNTDTSTFGDGHLNVKRSANTIYALSTGTAMSALGLGYSSGTNIDGGCGASNGAIAIGNGDTAVTFDDYALDSIISSGWTKGTPVIGTPSYNSETKKWSNTISFIVTNSSGSDMTIKEAGIYTNATANASATLVSLIYREVLASPVTITNGQSKTITLNLEYTMPTV